MPMQEVIYTMSTSLGERDSHPLAAAGKWVSAVNYLADTSESR
jgi:hypothetical protein